MVAGRKKSSFWKHFKTAAPPDKDKPKSSKNVMSAICNYCQFKYDFANASRLKTHLAQNCRQCPEKVRKEAQEALPVSSNKKLSIDFIGIRNSEFCELTYITSVCLDQDKNQPMKRKNLDIESSDEEEVDDVAIVKSHSQPQPTKSSSSQNKVSCQSSSNLSQGSMDGHVVKTTPETKVKLDEALARAVFMSNCPFNLFENPYWKKAINLLRPNYDPPNAYHVSDPLLNREYDSVMEASKSRLKAAAVLCLMTDGWTGPTGDCLINFMVSTPEPVFIKTVTAGKNQETAEFLAGETKTVIEELKTESVEEKKIFLVLSDNATVMRAMWVILQQIYPHIVVIGCSAHMLDLLLTDIMKQDSILFLRQIAKSIVIFIKRHNRVLAYFKEEQQERYGANAVSLKVPPKTRWFYFVICLCCLIKNKAALKATVIEETLDIDKDVRRNVLDDEGFWSNIVEVYKLLLPIALAIGKVEGDNVTLSEVPKLAKKINRKVVPLIEKSTVLSESEKKKCNDVIVRRLYYCFSEVHCAANILDPRYKGKHLDVTEKQSGTAFIMDQCSHLDLDKPTVMANLAEYKTKTGSFANEIEWGAAAKVSALTWWGGFHNEEPLFPIAQRLHSSPSTTAACERNWSFHGAIHSKSRNRLAKHRLEKRVAVRCNMRFSSNSVKEKKTNKKTARKSLLVDDFVDSDSDCDDELSTGLDVIDEEEIDLDLDCDSEYSETDSDNDDVPLMFCTTNYD